MKIRLNANSYYFLGSSNRAPPAGLHEKDSWAGLPPATARRRTDGNTMMSRPGGPQAEIYPSDVCYATSCK